MPLLRRYRFYSLGPVAVPIAIPIVVTISMAIISLAIPISIIAISFYMLADFI